MLNKSLTIMFGELDVFKLNGVKIVLKELINYVFTLNIPRYDARKLFCGH